jgi:hypothetical protein
MELAGVPMTMHPISMICAMFVLKGSPNSCRRMAILKVNLLIGMNSTERTEKKEDLHALISTRLHHIA